MGLKKGIGGLLGFTAVVGAVALAVKYLVDYTDFKEKASEDFHDIEGDSGDVKEAAKRTYTSLNMKDKAELKEAAKELAGAAGKVAVDAGSITVAAGKSAADHVKDTYSKYKEDPENAKAEVIGNFKGLAKDVSSKVSTKIGALGDTITGFKDEYKKNLEEIEAESERKKGEIAESSLRTSLRKRKSTAIPFLKKRVMRYPRNACTQPRPISTVLMIPRVQN